MTRQPHPQHGRHELLWEGKYGPDGKRRQPDLDSGGAALQVVESYPALVDPSSEGVSTAIHGGWKNRLVLGDNRDGLACLLPEFRGAIQLVYLDPPFGSEADYVMGNGRRGAGALAYRDRWGAGDISYLSFMAERLALMRELLTPSGCLFLHCDWHSSAVLRLLLDELFGADHFINEIVWYYYNKYSRGRHCLPRAHDTILVYGRTRAPALHPLRLKRDAPRRQLMRRNVNGVLRNARDAEGKLMYQIVHDKKADDVWTIPQLQPASAEWTGYATQKHPLLLERILALASRPDDLVADFFCGSGTTLVVAQRMGRRFLGGDLGETALHVTRRRLIQVPDRPELVVLRVKSSKRAAQAEQAGRGSMKQRAFVLRKLGATSTSRGSASGRLLGERVHIHIPGVALQARQAVELALGTKGRLICCAWDFEPAFWERLANEKDADAVVPVLLPRDWLNNQDASEAPARVLPRLIAVGRRRVGGPARVRLVGWVEPTLPDALKGVEGRTMQSLVDMWAVDPAWRPGQPFTAAWSTTRPRRGRLPLTSPPLSLGKDVVASGMLIQAWDALGVAATTWVELEPEGVR